MIELRFHREVYAGEAVDEAIGVYAGYADLERAEDPDAWIVRCTVTDSAQEKLVANELCNYALGLTIRRGGVD